MCALQTASATNASASNHVSAYVDVGQFVFVTHIVRDLIPLLFASVLSSGPFIGQVSDKSKSSAGLLQGMLC